MIKFIFNKIILILLLSGFQISYANTTPDTVVENLHQTIIQVMKESKDLDYDGRYNVLEPVVKDSFDFKTIARIVMGRHWKKLDDQQKTEFIDVFSRLSIATYASRFNSFSGETFDSLSNEEMKKGRMLVKTQLVTNDRVVPFNYVLHNTDDGWRIINVIADGISDLSLKRSDYSTIMKTEGFETLVKKLLKKVESSGAEP